METIGSLIDKIAITRLRLEAVAATHLQTTPVKEQLKSLQQEINSLLVLSIQGKVPLEEPKYKFYNGQPVVKDTCINFADCIEKLFIANYHIWHLEDLRRDETISCKKLKEINEESNVYNKLRNNMIDQINKIISFEIHKLK